MSRKLVAALALAACAGGAYMPAEQPAPATVRGPADATLRPRILPFGQVPFQSRRMRFAVSDSAYITAFLSEPVGGVTQLFPYRASQETRFGPGEHGLVLRRAFSAAPRASGARYVMLVAAGGPLNLASLHGLVAGYEGIRVTDRSLTVMPPDEALDRVLELLVTGTSGPWAAHIFEYVVGPAGG